MSPGCREWHSSVMLFAFIKRIVEMEFFSAIVSQLSLSKTVYFAPWHAEEPAADGASAAVVSGVVEDELVVPAEVGGAEDASPDVVSSGLVATVCPAPDGVSAEAAPPDPAVVEVSGEVVPSDPAVVEVSGEVAPSDPAAGEVPAEVASPDVVGPFRPAPVEDCAPVASPDVPPDVVATLCPASGDPDWGIGDA